MHVVYYTSDTLNEYVVQLGFLTGLYLTVIFNKIYLRNINKIKRSSLNMFVPGHHCY
jgi:hypothetical protein